MGPDPAVAALRLAVRRDIPVISSPEGPWSPEVRAGGCVMVACSGGADSLALLAATIFELRSTGIRVIGAVVDHGLQEGSAEHTTRVVAQMAALGADETASIRISVDVAARGIEAGAREARYAALGQLARHFDADLVLLGHTLDDQAETVLLGLTRGSGGRSIAGMRRGFYEGAQENEGPGESEGLGDGSFPRLNERSLRPENDPPRPGVRFSRPLLDITRVQTEAACRAEGIEFWTDPHNADPRFLRSRVRHTVLPLLEAELGPGVAQTLARTADQLRRDMESLDQLAVVTYREVATGSGIDLRIDVWALETCTSAEVSRVLRLAALEAGAIGSELFAVHVDALQGLALGHVTGKEIQLPGHVTAWFDGDHLRFRRTNS